jgi:hypothetical protein
MGSLLIKAKILVNLFFDPGPLVAIFIFVKGFFVNIFEGSLQTRAPKNFR